MEMYRRTYAEINLDHLAHNIRAIQRAFPQAPFLCPMVKANAYGHGDIRIALFLEKMGIKHLGVCLLEEGLTLREAGVKADILVFRGFDRGGAQKIIEHNLTPVVSSWEQLDHLEAVAAQSVGIHLKFDTGMNRLGFRVEEAQKIYERLWQNKKIRLIALATHLLNGEETYKPEGRSAEQLQKLHQVAQIFKSFQIFSHALNSGGILSQMYLQSQDVTASNSRHNLFLENWGLRPGLMIYGYNPTAQKDFIQLKPVMSLKSNSFILRPVPVGETVSYGGTWTAQRDSVIAVISIGYGDGYHRILSNQAHALFAGQKVSVVGTVCMDYLMLDVTDVVQGQAADSFQSAEVVLFGESATGAFLSAAELAREAKTITWEMLTSVGERVPRVFKGGQA